MYSLLIILLILIAGTVLLLQLDVFGARPGGRRLEIMRKSRNFRDGKFQNLSPTPSLAEGYSYIGVLYNFLLRRKIDLQPSSNVPVVDTDLRALPEGDVLVWFGHSSYLLRVKGKTFLVDPVLCGYASPFSWMNKAFKGADKYKPKDLPGIDYLVITHDHYDHLDYSTVKTLQNSVGKVICPLGVGVHFEKWGYPATQLIEKDWGDKISLGDDMTIYLTPARHFSGRSVFGNNTLWTSYVLETPSSKIFLGGDSGYDKHFAEIGRKFGGFDLAILENGQYNEAWRYIHTMPEEVLQVGKDLRAKQLFPVHSGKFDLGGHAWYEPLRRITELNKKEHMNLITPRIGEVVRLGDAGQLFTAWWETVKI